MLRRALYLLSILSLLTLTAGSVSTKNTAGRAGRQRSANKASRADSDVGPGGKGTGSTEEEVQKLLSRIPRELDPWRDGISMEMIERTYCTDLQAGFRIQILNGSVFILGEKKGFSEFNRMTKLLLMDLAREHALPDVDFVVSTTDGCPDLAPYKGNVTRCPQPAPLFAFDKRAQQQPQCVLFPDFTFGAGGWPLAKLPGWPLARSILEATGRRVKPWSERLPKLFFRGAHTGNRSVLTKDSTFTGHKDVDFQLTGWTGLTRDEEYVSLPEHCDYRHLLHLPGNGWSVRLKYLLLCEAAVIYPFDARSGWEEFWSHIIQDGEHLVMTPPLSNSSGGSHVLAALVRVEANPQQAQQMAKAGRRLIRDVLTPANVQRYFVELLEAYSKLQTFKPSLHPDARALERSVMGPDIDMRRSPGSCSSCANDIRRASSLATLETSVRDKLLNFSGQPLPPKVGLAYSNDLLIAAI